MTQQHPFRFGVSLFTAGSRSVWRARVREAEDLGYDVIQVADHLGLPAPFPALVAAADVTSIRLGTFVLNAGILSPTYLARDVAAVHRLTDGRLELGLGAGYVPAEFEAVGLPFGTPGERLRNLETTLAATRELLAAEPDSPKPPIMLGGAGDRMLGLAGREADIFSFSIMAGVTPGLAPEDALARRVQVLRDAAGDRFGDIELNLFVAAVGGSTDQVDLTIIRQASGLDDTQLGELPGVLVGSPQEIADRLLRYREQFGVSYISVLEPHMAAFAEVIKHLR
ncbi:probable F420-dependent oxidoreductase, MSMEG_2516 family [Streptomyces sp. DvalAA-14]|uniref:TIGR03621 family F420-dependent LLM class oxidoreductase n=1 Tax=unclassified Streptomyces TaxID=2593676 RepID=UPI00081B4333|nr:MULTISPECIES: TIGR03621 family F420-dependent LLM class oxidoreductase [unclassified Streptomyces]MYS23763.1 TIGR03621 family F420-dependent LLM class oxidoreductase [Streptomyces sp. SID4948]SCE38415.1 probable F420-dependent oxidoreductase, MSMEG_2516 family [Streptomyces sp. DvalAA-14]